MTTVAESIIEQGSIATRAVKAQRHFRLFVEDAWHVVEPGKPFIPGMHIDALCEHLQAVAEGKIKRLLVNMPPRHGKSTIISVLWPVWLLLRDPSKKILCASYAMDLATRDNVKSRRLIKSRWFQARYGHLFSLADDQDAKIKFETDQQGYRMAVSVGSAATGEGGDGLIGDDLHSIDEKLSQTKRQTAIDWFDNTFCTRLNDQQTGFIVVVGQRIHEDDISAHILQTDGDGWVHLNLPAEYESANPCRTYLYTGDEVPFWVDPRTVDGELLCPERFPRKVIERAKKIHQLDYFALYQQEPSAPGGNIFQIANERIFEENFDSYLLHTPKGIKPIPKEDCYDFLSVDPAISEKETADFMVIGLWSVTPYKDLLLKEVFRGHWNHADQQKEIREVFDSHEVEYVAVETVAYQTALFQDLVLAGIPCRPFSPSKDKVVRAGSAAVWQANGKMYFPDEAYWLVDYKQELYKFPKVAHDDQVDMTSLGSIVVRSRGPLSDDVDDEDIPDAVEETGGLIPLTAPLQGTPEEQAAAIEKAEQESRRYIDPFVWAEEHGGLGGDW